MSNYITKGVVRGFKYKSILVGDELVHYVTLTGPVGLDERRLLYPVLLGDRAWPNFFGIQDNSQRHPNDLTFEAINALCNLLRKMGIRVFYKAIITRDRWFEKIAEISTLQLNQNKINGTIVRVDSIEEAESFISDVIAGRHIEQIAGIRNNSSS